MWERQKQWCKTKTEPRTFFVGSNNKLNLSRLYRAITPDRREEKFFFNCQECLPATKQILV